MWRKGALAATPELDPEVELHRAFAVLPDDGAFETSAEWFDVTGGEVSVILKYTADPGAENGFPCYLLAWRFALDESTEATAYQVVKLSNVSPDGPYAPITRLTARVECFDLLDGDATFRIDTVRVPPGAKGLRIVPAELGDIDNPGSLGVWIGSAT